MKPGGQYKKGANAERRWVNAMRATVGCLMAGRVAGSKTPVDCWAIFEDKIVLRQIKSGQSPNNLKEYRQLLALDGRTLVVDAGIERV